MSHYMSSDERNQILESLRLMRGYGILDDYFYQGLSLFVMSARDHKREWTLD